MNSRESWSAAGGGRGMPPEEYEALRAQAAAIEARNAARMPLSAAIPIAILTGIIGIAPIVIIVGGAVIVAKYAYKSLKEKD